MVSFPFEIESVDCDDEQEKTDLNSGFSVVVFGTYKCHSESDYENVGDID